MRVRRRRGNEPSPVPLACPHSHSYMHIGWATAAGFHVAVANGGSGGLPMFVKRRVGALALAACLGAAIVLYATPAQAFVTYNDHLLIQGVGDYGHNNQYYYVDSSASVQRNTAIAAMNDWIYTTGRLGITTPISFLRTTYRPASVMDIFRVSYVSPTWWAHTTWNNGLGVQNPSEAHWLWGLIELSNDYPQCPNQRGVIAHEMGHVMGLDHRLDDASTLMYLWIS